MPTIELVSIECAALPALSNYSSFAYQLESDLESHRSLFQPVFDSLSGVIVHLGNKDLEEEDNFWFAGQLVDWQYGDALVFLPEVRRDIKGFMQELIALSPHKRITFSSDYQFGGEQQEHGEISLSQFLQLHDEKKLRYNSLWYIQSGAKARVPGCTPS